MSAPSLLYWDDQRKLTFLSEAPQEARYQTRVTVAVELWKGIRSLLPKSLKLQLTLPILITSPKLSSQAVAILEAWFSSFWSQNVASVSERMYLSLKSLAGMKHYLRTLTIEELVMELHRLAIVHPVKIICPFWSKVSLWPWKERVFFLWSISKLWLFKTYQKPDKIVYYFQCNSG